MLSCVGAGSASWVNRPWHSCQVMTDSCATEYTKSRTGLAVIHVAVYLFHSLWLTGIFSFNSHFCQITEIDSPPAAKPLSPIDSKLPETSFPSDRIKFPKTTLPHPSISLNVTYASNYILGKTRSVLEGGWHLPSWMFESASDNTTNCELPQWRTRWKGKSTVTW